MANGLTATGGGVNVFPPAAGGVCGFPKLKTPGDGVLGCFPNRKVPEPGVCGAPNKTGAAACWTGGGDPII